MDIKDFTALDTDTLIDVGLVQPTPEVNNNEPGKTEPVTPAEPATEPPATEPPAPTTTPLTEIEIEGLGKVKVDDIKEWQKGNMRQSDYTRKTQEVAKQREEMNDALEVYNYLKNNPHLIEGLKKLENTPVDTKVIDKATPQYDMVREVFLNQKQMQLDHEMARLRSEHGNINEDAFYQEAERLQLPIEGLEFLYKAMAYEQGATPAKTPPNNVTQQPVDIEALKAQIRAEMQQEQQATQYATSTMVSKPSAPMNQTVNTQLTEDEKRVARAMNMSDEDYAKWGRRK